MKTFTEWLQEFRKKIDEGYERSRMDRALARDAEQVDRPVRALPKLDEPIKLYSVPPGGKLPPPISFGFRTVEPKNVGFFCDLKDWADDPREIILMWRLGEFLAEREYFWIVKSLLENAGHTTEVETKGTLTKSDIQKAREKISESGLFGDRLVIPREYVLKWWKEKQLWEAHRIPTGYVPEEQRGRYFWGWIDGFNVYSARFLKDVAVLFDRNEIIIRNTLHTVSFDNMNRPKKLIIEKWCSSAPIIDDAITKIKL